MHVCGFFSRKVLCKHWTEDVALLGVSLPDLQKALGSSQYHKPVILGLGQENKKVKVIVGYMIDLRPTSLPCFRNKQINKNHHSKMWLGNTV